MDRPLQINWRLWEQHWNFPKMKQICFKATTWKACPRFFSLHLKTWDYSNNSLPLISNPPAWSTNFGLDRPQNYISQFKYTHTSMHMKRQKSMCAHAHTHTNIMYHVSLKNHDSGESILVFLWPVYICHMLLDLLTSNLSAFTS